MMEQLLFTSTNRPIVIGEKLVRYPIVEYIHTSGKDHSIPDRKRVEKLIGKEGRH